MSGEANGPSGCLDAPFCGSYSLKDVFLRLLGGLFLGLAVVCCLGPRLGQFKARLLGYQPAVPGKPGYTDTRPQLQKAVDDANTALSTSRGKNKLNFRNPCEKLQKLVEKNNSTLPKYQQQTLDRCKLYEADATGSWRT